MNHDARLSDLQVGEEGTVLTLEGGYSFLGRMTALGFTPGATVRMLRNYGHGPLIVSVLDTQVALGRHQAAHVIVRCEVLPETCRRHRWHAR